MGKSQGFLTHHQILLLLSLQAGAQPCVIPVWYLHWAELGVEAALPPLKSCCVPPLLSWECHDHGSSLAAFLGLCLPATSSWIPLGSQDQLTSCIRGSCRASLWPGSLSKPVSHLQHPAPRGDKPSFRALQQVPGPGATIPADGIKDSSFLCWIQLQGLLSHSSSPHSPISQQLWSRYSCKKSNLCIAFFLLHCYVPCHTCPAFHPAAGTGCFFYSPLAIQP